ncbi:major capsid protein PB7 [Saline Natrinema sp. J7-1 virus 1]|uniref:Major capsid protein PB7 n=1 Tax=Saline Natrinema sp. J7-1 virus 1 TaxID=2847285 RepID=A0AAE9VKQ9_9VIRU|nr:major capsid protein PB7 [Saline Natrinema sp. J7-1 virus 1]WBE14030.1 major capsid protein PB7 [Saline Natrinema sp. J7-1 virus 1]
MGRNINHNSDIVELQENTPGDLTPIMTIVPEEGTMIQIQNRVPQGSAVGLPIYADPRDANGDPLPVDTSLVLTAKQPGDPRRTPVSLEVDNISTFLNKTISEQQSTDHVDATKIELRGRAVNVRDIDELAVEINSSRSIDWSNSKLYFERAGVAEKQR